MLITIYDSTGTPKAQLSPNDTSTQVKEVQGDSVLTLSFTHYDHIALDVDDYVDFEGERFWLSEKYRPRQNARKEWVYDIKLYGVESMLKRLLVIKTVDGEDEPVFTLTAPPREHVAMIVGCMNSGMGNITGWKVGTVNGSDNIVIDYFGKYCDEALREIAGKVGAEWWVEGQTVNICRCEHGEPIPMGYGNGLLSIDPGTADNVKFYTRLYPVGSSRNIDSEKYGFSRLQLPGGLKYVEVNADRYGRVDHYEKDAFADIYPRRTGTVSSVRSEVKTGDDGNPFTIYYFKDDELPFDPNDYEIGGLVKRVSFQEGSELAGLGDEDNGSYYFEVNFNSSTSEFEIITIWPYDDGSQLPGNLLVPKPGDRYILWNLRMPDEYYSLAEVEFLEAVQKYNQDHGLDIAVYKAPTDHVWIEDNEIGLTVGQRIRLESEEFFPETGFRKSRITRITRKVNLPSQMDIEISDALSRTSQQKMTDSIADVRSFAKSIGESTGLPDIIRTGDLTLPTDNNLLSARRSYRDLLRKNQDDRSKGKIASDKGFEVGNFLAGVSGAIIGKDAETGQTFGEMDRLFIRIKAYFETLTIINAETLAGKQYISPGGGVKCTSVGEVKDAQGTLTGWRCYFLSEQDGEKTETKMIVGDQAISEMFNAKEGTSNKVSNHRWWRLVTAVSNDAYTDDSGNHYGYIELSASNCEAGSDAPEAGDEICQLGYQGADKPERQTAMILSTVDADAPSIKMLSGIGSGNTLAEHYSLADKAIISFGRDPITNKVYFRLGNSTATQYLEYTQDNGLKVAGSITTTSTIDGKTFDDYIREIAPEFDDNELRMLIGLAQGAADSAQDSADKAQADASDAAQAASDAYDLADAAGTLAGSAYSKATAAEAQVNALKYLSDSIGQAVADSTHIVGGLMLSTMIALGYTEGEVRHILSGMNGSYNSDLGGRTPAAWYGGNMIDRFDPLGLPYQSPPANAATSMLRMDGSAYFNAGATVFNADKSGWLADGAISWDKHGSVTFNSGIKLDLYNEDGDNETVGSLFGALNSLSNIFFPVGADGNRMKWSEIQKVGGKWNVAYLRSMVSLVSEGEVTAYGSGDEAPSDGEAPGFGLLKIWTQPSAGNDNDAFSASAVWNALGAIPAKVSALEEKNYLDNLSLTVSGSGNAVTAVTHSSDKKSITFVKGSTFLTSHQSLSAYLKSADAAATYLSKSDAAASYQPVGTYLSEHQPIFKLSFAAGAFSAKTYTPNSAAQTVSIPTTTSHISEGSRLYFTDARAQAALAATVSLLESAIAGKVDKADGYSLSKNDFSDALLTKLNGIESGANNYVHPSATAKTLAAASGKVISAITVSSLGHVTSVANKSLAQADIPALAISKVTNLQTSLDSKLDKSVFEGMFELVVNGNSTYIRAKHGFVSVGEVTGYASDGYAGASGNAAAASLFALSDVLISNPAVGQALIFNGSDWVNQSIPAASASPFALTVQKNGANVAVYDGSSAKTANITVGWSDTASGRPSWIGSSKPSYNFSEIGSKPTTIAGYGISDAKIANGVITLGSNTITPLVASNMKTLTFAAGAFSAKTYTPNSAAVTVNVPQKLTHLTNNLFVIGTQTAATNLWTGNVDGLTAYYDGLTIDYYLPFAGNSTAATLNLNGLGAKPMYNGRKGNITTHYVAGSVVRLTYYNGYFYADAYYDSNSTYSGFVSAYCSTAAGTAAKAASASNFALTAGVTILVRFTAANTVSGALTLNVNSTGAKPLYINGTVSSASNHTLAAGSYPCYYDGTNWYVYTDATYRFTNILADKIAKVGGTSSQFLKADGSVDSNTYITSHQSLANYVTLDGAQTITGAKTFNAILTISPANASSIQDGLVLHDRGSGANEGLRIRWTSGSYTDGITLSGNPSDNMITSSAMFVAPSFIKSGGTSSQFLKADGSVDSNSYALASGLTDGSVTKVGTATKGSASLPIYLNAGTPTACTASSVFSALAMSGNNLSVTVAGQNRTLTVGYATKAAQLNTARTLWGRSFNGTANISGDMTGVGSINYQGEINLKAFTSDYARGLNVIGGTSGESIAAICGVYGNNDSYRYLYYGGQYNSPFMVMLPSGNVGIGTTSPAYNLDVINSARFAGVVIESTNEINTYGYALCLNYSSNQKIILAQGGGNVGIGIITPSSKLHVAGNILATGEVTGFTSSDRRLKKNIRPISKAADIIRSLRPVQFNWNKKAVELNSAKDTRRLNYGLVAQEVETVLPDIVHEIYGEYMSVDYEQVIPILVMMCQELSRENSKLKQRMSKIERR